MGKEGASRNPAQGLHSLRLRAFSDLSHKNAPGHISPGPSFSNREESEVQLHCEFQNSRIVIAGSEAGAGLAGDSPEV